MKSIVFFEDSAAETLLPLTFTRPVARLRIGILTISEKWSKRLNATISYKTRSYLRELFTSCSSQDNLYINGSVCPDEQLVQQVGTLASGEALVQGAVIIAFNASGIHSESINISDAHFKKIAYAANFIKISYPEDVFKHNGIELTKDFALISSQRTSKTVSSTNTVLGDNIFVEEGAMAECSTFNTLTGPIYIGRNAQVWEGSNIRGPFALCEGARVKMGSKMYPDTTIGPHCTAGGEISNSVMMANSAKGHEGYLGNAVIGEWCNIGGGSNNSNLKNNYANVKLWDYTKQTLRDTGLYKCGLIMGDHSKCGITTMFNTGTVVGVGANLFGGRIKDTFIPDFSWGGADDLSVYRLDKALETFARVQEKRGDTLCPKEMDMLTEVFKLTQQYRTFK